MTLDDVIARLMMILIIAGTVLVYWNDAMDWGEAALADAVLIAPTEN